MSCYSRHRLPAVLVALMLLIAWLLQWISTMSCNFITVNTVTITNSSSHNTGATYSTHPTTATFYHYEANTVGVFCAAQGATVDAFWKLCRTLSIFTIILTTLTVITSIACLLARVSIPVEAARLWWGIGLISAISALCSAPLFWLDPCDTADASYRNQFEETIATVSIDSTCTPHNGFIQWILQGALQIMVSVITIIAEAPWDAAQPPKVDQHELPRKSIALMEDSEGLENEEDQNDSEIRIQMMMDQSHFIEQLIDENNSITGKSVVHISSSSTVGSELSDLSSYTNRGAAIGSLPPLLSHDTHSTKSVEETNDYFFHDDDEGSNSSREIEHSAPLLLDQKLLNKSKRVKDNGEARSPNGSTYEYEPPPTFELPPPIIDMRQVVSQNHNREEKDVDGLYHEDDTPTKKDPHWQTKDMPVVPVSVIISSSEDDESSDAPHSIFSSSFSNRYWNNTNDKSFDEIWFANDTNSAISSMILSPIPIEQKQFDHQKTSNGSGVDTFIDTNGMGEANNNEGGKVENLSELITANPKLACTSAEENNSPAVFVHIPPLSKNNQALLDYSAKEIIQDLDLYQTNIDKSPVRKASTTRAPYLISRIRKQQQGYDNDRLDVEVSKAELPSLSDCFTSTPKREGLPAFLFPTVRVHTPTLSSRNQRLVSAAEDETKSAKNQAEVPSSPAVANSKLSVGGSPSPYHPTVELHTPKLPVGGSPSPYHLTVELHTPKGKNLNNNSEKTSVQRVPLSPIGVKMSSNVVAVHSPATGTDGDNNCNNYVKYPKDRVSFCGSNLGKSEPPCSPIFGESTSQSVTDMPSVNLVSETNSKWFHANEDGVDCLPSCEPSRSLSEAHHTPILFSFSENQTQVVDPNLNLDSQHSGTVPSNVSSSQKTNKTVPTSQNFETSRLEKKISKIDPLPNHQETENAQSETLNSPIITNVYALLGELKDHVRNLKASPVRLHHNIQAIQKHQGSTPGFPLSVEDQLSCHKKSAIGSFIEEMDSVPFDEVDKSQERVDSITAVSPEPEITKSNPYFVIKPVKIQQKKQCKAGQAYSVVTPDRKKYSITSSTPPRYPRSHAGNITKNRIALRQTENCDIETPNPVEVMHSEEMEV